MIPMGLLGMFLDVSWNKKMDDAQCLGKGVGFNPSERRINDGETPSLSPYFLSLSTRVSAMSPSQSREVQGRPGIADKTVC